MLLKFMEEWILQIVYTIINLIPSLFENEISFKPAIYNLSQTTKSLENPSHSLKNYELNKVPWAQSWLVNIISTFQIVLTVTSPTSKINVKIITLTFDP